MTALYVPHTDTTFGYRIERDGWSVAYVSDHQQPDDALTVEDAVLDLCRGVDVLIHDAQFTPAEYECKKSWGHCTIDFAVRVAAVAGAKKLVLFHHDPSHDDDMLDQLALAASVEGRKHGVDDVVAAFEGLRISLV